MMELFFIIYDIDFNEDIMRIIGSSETRGFTKWDRVMGKGKTSDPKMDDAVWPGFNSAVFLVLDDEDREAVLADLEKLSGELGGKGLKVFALPVREVI